MFFDDEDLALRKRVRLKQLPETPETNWRPPTEFPNLSAATVLGIDTETKETDFEHGPGWARGPKGHIVGFSLSARDRLGNRGNWYFPIRHEVEPQYNLDPASCLSYLRHCMSTPSIPKVGANIYYDVGWLTEEKIFVEGLLYDCQYAEALLDDAAEVALDHLGLKYFQEGKQSSLLYKWIREAYGVRPGKERAEIWRTSPRLVGPYAETDADLPLRVLEKQWPQLMADGLMPVFQMECALIRLLVRMRIKGVHVDTKYAHRLYDRFAAHAIALQQQLARETGVDINVNSGKQVAVLFNHLQIPHDNTFTKPFLEGIDHPAIKILIQIRKLLKLNSTFIKGYLIEGSHNGLIHSTLNPLKVTEDADTSGAKTGRYSSDDPNLQNLPVRTEEGKMIRQAFIPDEGHAAWEKKDYSQIEYRYLAHFAVGPGALELRQDYRDNPQTDYHDRVYYKACPFLKLDPNDEAVKKKWRRPIKNTNFGLVFGQGKKKLTRTLHLSKKEADTFFEAYHKSAPYVKPTMAAIAQEVQTFGYITTILGRRVRFNLWEPAEKQPGEYFEPYEYKRALMEYGANIKRAYDYRGVNYKLQGSGTGDQIKKSMLDCYEAGIFEITGVPKIQVHDELDFSVIDYSREQHEAYTEMKYRMENAIKIDVPVFVDTKRGLTWGDAD